MDSQFPQPNQFMRCAKSSFSLWLSSLLRGYMWLLAAMYSALQDLRLGLHALAGSLSNRRIYLGLILMLVVAPLFGVGYQLFDLRSGIDRIGQPGAWYYINNFYLFFELCPHIALVTILTGIFFLFPENSRRAYFLIIPAGYHLAKILWLLTVDSNEDFYRIVPSSFLVIGSLFAFVHFLTFNWLMSLHFHKREGVIARILGILDTPGLKDRDVLRIARAEKQSLKTIE